MSYPRTLFILKNRDIYFECDSPYTVHRSSGLLISATFLTEMLNEFGFTAKLVHVVDSNSIHAQVVAFKANVVIIEAYWVLPSKFVELQRACPGVQFVVRNHSELPFMSADGCAIDRTLEYIGLSNVTMACNSLKATRDIQFLASREYPLWTVDRINSEVVYLPNYYPTDSAVAPVPKTGNILNIGCFGAVRPLKNQLIQAVAALKYASSVGKTLNFHINGSRIEMNSSSILKNLVNLFAHLPNDKLIQHDWLEHDAFLEVVKTMDLMLQVSFTETFNIVTADAVVCGVPVVVSDQVSWIPEMFQAQPDDTDDIMAKMVVASTNPDTDRSNVYGLEQSNRDTTRSWLKFLSAY